MPVVIFTYCLLSSMNNRVNYSQFIASLSSVGINNILYDINSICSFVGK